MTKEQIIDFFKGCALNLKADWSEDDLIHCFKKDQPCTSGRQLLSEQTDLLNDESLHFDPFNPTDSDVEDANVETNLLVADDTDEELIDIL